MNKYASVLLKHWQSTLVGLLILIIGGLYATKHINTSDFGIAITTVIGLWTMFTKDPNKTQSKE